ncbi:MAG: phosphotransferase [Polyangiales bacterium]
MAGKDEKVDRVWLEGVLREAGCLTRGHITALEQHVNERLWSTLYQVSLHYSRDAAGEQPARLWVKRCAGQALLFPRSEVDYYTRDYCDCQDAPLPRVYGAAYAAETGDYTLVLEDLTVSHGIDHPPDRAYASGVAGALASLHAHHWGPARLQTHGEQLPGAAELARYGEHIEARLDRGVVLAGESLPPPLRALLPEVVGQARGQLAAAAELTEGMTLVHGDTSPGNILFPYSGSGRVYLIDRQPFTWSLRVWLGVSDLAHMLVLFWPPEVRRALQQHTFEAYAAALQARGVDYSLAQIARDYHASIVQYVCYATQWLGLRDYGEPMRSNGVRRLAWALEAYREER